MGQYYQAVLGSRSGWNKKIYYPLDYDQGLKLLEHGYIDSDFCKKIQSELYKSPKRVIWVGDYANDKTDSFYSESNRILEEKPRSIPKAKLIWKNGTQKDKRVIEEVNGIDYMHKFLVNHTLHVYLDIEKYCNTASANPWGIIDPLPILTVVGNGRGGGDYHGTNENRIGSWKWHLISVEDFPPKGYTKLRARDYSFVEGP